MNDYQLKYQNEFSQYFCLLPCHMTSFQLKTSASAEMSSQKTEVLMARKSTTLNRHDCWLKSFVLKILNERSEETRVVSFKAAGGLFFIFFFGGGG